MLIRSQDGEGLFVLENALYLYVDSEYDVVRGMKFYQVIELLPLDTNPFEEEDFPIVSLGDYSTREKAQKVLDSIGEWYRMESNPEAYGIELSDPVFQMPQDEEVDA